MFITENDHYSLPNRILYVSDYCGNLYDLSFMLGGLMKINVEALSSSLISNGKICSILNNQN